MIDEPKQRSRAWIGWALLAALVLYPLSIGPAVWIVDSLGIRALTRSYRAFYAPIFWAFDRSVTVADWVLWYANFWRNYKE
jgi:hypothetical protein